MPNLNDLARLAEFAAREAGEILLSARLEISRVNSAQGKDIKTAADEESEKLIRRILSERSPYPVIGEEQGGKASLLEGDECFWVVDPLDGTYNYMRQFPLTAVVIALFRGMTPLLGVVLDFERNECFVGIPGQGLTLNGDPFKPEWADNMGQAALATGFPSGRDYSTESLMSFVSQVQSFKKIRMMGTAALAISYVAAGRVDVYHEEASYLWDFGAGWALVLAAGGVVHVRRNPIKPLAFDVWAAGKPEFLAPWKL